MAKKTDVKKWVSEIQAAQSREKDWRKEAREALEIYNGRKKDEIPFNILYSNTETMMPALYNSTPRPIVDRRFKDDDPLGKAAAQAAQRVLAYSVDTNSEEYATFDDAMSDAVLDSLLPGRAATRIRYDAMIVPETDESPPDVPYEQVCYESIRWDRLTIGFARKWARVPWLSFSHDVTEPEAVGLFGLERAGKLTYSALDLSGTEGDERHEHTERTDEERKVARVYEIWDRAGGKAVRFISPTWTEEPLKEEDDPLDLTGFFPIPCPLRFLRKSNDLEPTVPYKLYENQAEELNRIQRRINRVVEALKVRGAYDSTLKQDIENILTSDDNIMVGAERVSALQDGGLDKAIWLFPVEKLVTVLQQLYIARESCKNVIYEITGIADIMRGVTKASETLGAQELKAQWGGLRLRRLQRDVQQYAREILRISLEIAAKKFAPKTFKLMTGLPYPLQAEKDAAQKSLQMAIQQAAVTGKPPSPPQVQQILSQPSWEEVLSVLKNDTFRQYRVDIETNSTVDLEATEDQKEISKALGAISQFLQGVSPLVQSGAMPFQIAQSMLLTVVRRFRFGTEIEDQIKGMQPPKPPGDGKAAASQMAAQLRVQEIQANASIEQQKLQQTREMEQAKATLEVATLQHNQQFEMVRLTHGRETELARIEAEKVAKLAELQAQRATEQMRARLEQETEIRKAALHAATQIEVAKITATKDRPGLDAEAARTAVATAQSADIMARIIETQSQLLDAINSPNDLIARLEQTARTMSTPLDIVRHPVTGRALKLVPMAPS